jgi:ketosteroid isomerase-like protein
MRDISSGLRSWARARLAFALLLVLASAVAVEPAVCASPRDGAQASRSSSDEVELARLETELVAAIASRDLRTYDRIVADDYVVVNASGDETTKAQVMASYNSGERAYPGLAIDEVKARAFGDAGIVSARTLGMRRENGRDVANRVRYVRVYARRNGVWRAVAQMATPLP